MNSYGHCTLQSNGSIGFFPIEFILFFYIYTRCNNAVDARIAVTFDLNCHDTHVH